MGVSPPPLALGPFVRSLRFTALGGRRAGAFQSAHQLFPRGEGLPLIITSSGCLSSPATAAAAAFRSLAIAIAAPARAWRAITISDNANIFSLSIKFLHVPSSMPWRDDRRMHAVKVGYFPHLRIAEGWGLRFCGVRAAPGATPPKSPMSLSRVKFRNERCSVSTMCTTSAMRITIVGDVT